MTKPDMLSEAKRLHGLGFAIHYLNPRSKRPIESGWTTGPRKTWSELKKTFHPDNNLGVRLGTPSHIAGYGYLAVIDVDLKSGEAHHLREALAALRSLTGDSTCPEVRSGRGNGSRHLYCVTAGPFKTWNPAESSEMVKYLSPSKKPSQRELAELTEKEIEKGWRLSRAWEISLYSDGRQVVLPPSVHPDSGERYAWKVPLLTPSGLPFLEFPGTPVHEMQPKSPPQKTQETVEDFEIDESLDIRWCPEVPDSVRKLICEGLWREETITDRSAYLILAASKLAKAGLDKNAILTILTDRTTFLGECTYEHAGNTRSRARAAKWLWNYTVKKVMNERDPVAAFGGRAVIAPATLDPDASLKQASELVTEDDPEERGYYHRGKNGALKADYDALMARFQADHPFKTIVDMKVVYRFTGTHYEELSKTEIKGFAEKRLNPKPEDKIRTEFYCKLLANNHARRRELFIDSIEGKINFKNGVLDLTNTQLGAHSPDYGFRGILPYDYNPQAKCPVFKKWLSEIMLGDEGLMRVLQEFMGFIVRGGEYKYHKALWLGGVGRNGKSTFIDLLKALIGPKNFSTVSIKSLVGDRFAGAALDGMIANFSEETSPQELADSGPFKNLTSGGDSNVQKKFGDSYSLKNRAKLIMTYNQIPDLKDLSAGMLSRPIIIPFRKIIKEEEQDRSIQKKLFAELPGIFNFALRGWHRLEKQNGFTKSELSELALKTIKEESCNVYQWVENFIEFDETQERTYKPHELYSIYQTRERYAYKAVEFYRRLNAHPGMKKQRKRKEDGSVYLGIQVR